LWRRLVDALELVAVVGDGLLLPDLEELLMPILRISELRPTLTSSGVDNTAYGLGLSTISMHEN
jgi:hypothetical protein